MCQNLDIAIAAIPTLFHYFLHHPFLQLVMKFLPLVPAIINLLLHDTQTLMNVRKVKQAVTNFATILMAAFSVPVMKGLYFAVIV